MELGGPLCEPRVPHINMDFVEKIMSNLKSQGLFDQLRKDCVADVDTKPAYQNLRQRVQTTVSEILSTLEFKPDLNKNKTRDFIRQRVFLMHKFDKAVDHVVNQMINSKTYEAFTPLIQAAVHEVFGYEMPANMKENKGVANGEIIEFGADMENGIEKKGAVTLQDLLPKDLDPISPTDKFSDSDEFGDDDSLKKETAEAAFDALLKSNMDKSVEKSTDDVSPEFEPLNESTDLPTGNAISDLEEISADSSISLGSFAPQNGIPESKSGNSEDTSNVTSTEDETKLSSSPIQSSSLKLNSEDTRELTAEAEAKINVEVSEIPKPHKNSSKSHVDNGEVKKKEDKKKHDERKRDGVKKKSDDRKKENDNRKSEDKKKEERADKYESESRKGESKKKEERAAKHEGEARKVESKKKDEKSEKHESDIRKVEGKKKEEKGDKHESENRKGDEKKKEERAAKNEIDNRKVESKKKEDRADKIENRKIESKKKEERANENENRKVESKKKEERVDKHESDHLKVDEKKKEENESRKVESKKKEERADKHDSEGRKGEDKKKEERVDKHDRSRDKDHKKDGRDRKSSESSKKESKDKTHKSSSSSSSSYDNKKHSSKEHRDKDGKSDKDSRSHSSTSSKDKNHSHHHKSSSRPKDDKSKTEKDTKSDHHNRDKSKEKASSDHSKKSDGKRSDKDGHRDKQKHSESKERSGSHGSSSSSSHHHERRDSKSSKTEDKNKEHSNSSSSAQDTETFKSPSKHEHKHSNKPKDAESPLSKDKHGKDDKTVNKTPDKNKVSHPDSTNTKKLKTEHSTKIKTSTDKKDVSATDTKVMTKKPKIAANIYEVKKIMQMRKDFDRMEKNRQKQSQAEEVKLEEDKKKKEEKKENKIEKEEEKETIKAQRNDTEISELHPQVQNIENETEVVPPSFDFSDTDDEGVTSFEGVKDYSYISADAFKQMEDRIMDANEDTLSCISMDSENSEEMGVVIEQEVKLKLNAKEWHKFRQDYPHCVPKESKDQETLKSLNPKSSDLPPLLGPQEKEAASVTEQIISKSDNMDSSDTAVITKPKKSKGIGDKVAPLQPKKRSAARKRRASSADANKHLPPPVPEKRFLLPPSPAESAASTENRAERRGEIFDIEDELEKGKEKTLLNDTLEAAQNGLIDSLVPTPPTDVHMSDSTGDDATTVSPNFVNGETKPLPKKPQAARGRMKRGQGIRRTNIKQQQRYENSDLYKPRPTFTPSRRLREIAANAKAEAALQGAAQPPQISK